MQIHITRKNETLQDVSRLYAIPKHNLLSVNGFSENDSIPAGTPLLLPIEGQYFFLSQNITTALLPNNILSVQTEHLKNTQQIIRKNSRLIHAPLTPKSIKIQSFYTPDLRQSSFVPITLHRTLLTDIIVSQARVQDVITYPEDFTLIKTLQTEQINPLLELSHIPIQSNTLIKEIKERGYTGVIVSEKAALNNETVSQFYKHMRVNNLSVSFVINWEDFEKIGSVYPSQNCLIKVYSDYLSIIEFIKRITLLMTKYPSSSPGILLNIPFVQELKSNQIKQFDYEKQLPFTGNKKYYEDLRSWFVKVACLYEVGIDKICVDRISSQTYPYLFLLKHFFDIKK